MIRIYNFPRGVRGLRVAWLCEEMGLSYEVKKLDFPVDEAYRALNPLGNVPFLEDEGGVAINESVAMMLFLAERYGPTPLMPARNDPDLARVLQLTVFAEASLGAVLNTLMAAHFGAPEADKRNWSIRGSEARAEQALAFLVDVLGDRDYLVGDKLTLADMAIATSLGMWKGALDKTTPESLARWREKLSQRPAYKRALAANG